MLCDSWFLSSPENLSEALFLSQVEFTIANGELANGQERVMRKGNAAWMLHPGEMG